MAEFLASQYGLSRMRLPPETFSGLSVTEEKTVIAKFQSWYQNLSPIDRSESLIVTHKPLVQLLCQMHLKKLNEGEGSFSLLESSSSSSSLEDSVYFHRSSTSIRPEDWELEREIRIFDVQSYLDSFTVTDNLTQGTLRFMELASVISENKAFTLACRAVLKSGGSDWQWDLPHWFNTSYFSLSQLALALLEQSIWKSYWKSVKINPGKTPGNTLIPIQTGAFGASGIKKQLIDYWKTLKKSTRIRVLGDLTEMFTATKAAKCSCASSSFSHSKEFSAYMPAAFAPHKHYSALHTERNKFEDSESVAMLSELVANATSERLFGVLFFSQMHRAGTSFDQVCRQVVIKVRTAYTLHEANSTLKKLKRDQESDGSSSDSSLFIQDPVFPQETIIDDSFED